MRSITQEQRRRLVVQRHQLAGGAPGPEAVVESLLALHATDPASVYLSVLARSRSTTLAGISEALYGRRSLVRWMAMRRTLFVFGRQDIPMVQAAASADVGAAMRRRLISRLRRNGCTPPVRGDVATWLAGVETEVEGALERRGPSTGAELAAEVAGLRSLIAPGAPSERPQRLTTALLTLMGADGRIVRGSAVGSWTNRQHRWEPVASWWPDGIAAPDPGEARAELARRWLERFGPATVEDLRWWTGWNVTAARAALTQLTLVEVDLHGDQGIVLPGTLEEIEALEPGAPVAALLPALDPTPMGFKRRDWFLGVEPEQLFDRAGNIGPTLWWDGEVVGAWAVSADGEVRWSIQADRGAEARAAIGDAAQRLEQRLGGAAVKAAFWTPLARELLSDATSSFG